MTADESIMVSWLLYSEMKKKNRPGESLKQSVHGLAASTIQNWLKCLLKSNSKLELEFNLN